MVRCAFFKVPCLSTFPVPSELFPPKALFRPDEVADLLALSRRTIYRMIRDGRLPSVKLGAGPWRVPRNSLARLASFHDVGHDLH